MHKVTSRTTGARISISICLATNSHVEYIPVPVNVLSGHVETHRELCKKSLVLQLEQVVALEHVLQVASHDRHVAVSGNDPLGKY